MTPLSAIGDRKNRREKLLYSSMPPHSLEKKRKSNLPLSSMDFDWREKGGKGGKKRKKRWYVTCSILFRSVIRPLKKEKKEETLSSR